MTVRTVDSNRARIHWREVLDAARAGDDSVIEHYGKPTAVVMPFADWEALQEELDDLRAARRAQAALEAYQRDPSLGTPLDQLEAEFRVQGLMDA